MPAPSTTPKSTRGRRPWRTHTEDEPVPRCARAPLAVAVPLLAGWRGRRGRGRRAAPTHRGRSAPGRRRADRRRAPPDAEGRRVDVASRSADVRAGSSRRLERRRPHAVDVRRVQPTPSARGDRQGAARRRRHAGPETSCRHDVDEIDRRLLRRQAAARRLEGRTSDARRASVRRTPPAEEVTGHPSDVARAATGRRRPRRLREPLLEPGRPATAQPASSASCRSPTSSRAPRTVDRLMPPYPCAVMTPAAARTYEVRTYGCQMNVHDSERLSGLLEDAGYVAAPDGEQADVVVFNTCAVRENADNKLYGNLGHLAPVKADAPRHADRGRRLPRAEGPRRDHPKAPWVDVVFGTHNIGSLPVLLERARVQEEAQVEILESLEVFPSTLPTKRESAYAAWVSISVGLQQHLHVLHRPGAARQGEGPPARRRARRDRGAGRRGRQRGDPARPERQLLRRRVRRPAGVRQAAARVRRDRGAGAGALHLARTPRTSPTT